MRQRKLKWADPYLESSPIVLKQNPVNLHKEFLSIKPTIRNFEANRQIFLMESTNLQKVINQLGSSS